VFLGPEWRNLHLFCLCTELTNENTMVPRFAVSSLRVLLIIHKSVNERFNKIHALWGCISLAGTARAVRIAAVFQLSLGVL
jgi:hypothetical protein